MTSLTVRRFHEPQEPGDPDCKCSLCGNAFTEEEIPVMLFGGVDVPEEEDYLELESWIMRYHPSCFEQVFELNDGSFVKRPDVELEVEWGD